MSWLNDAAVQNHNGAGFNHLNDSNTPGNTLDFMTNSSFDPPQIQNQQLQQRMQNGAMRNGSPAFNNPVYQTNQVIPSKRPRPREESFSTSPRQAPAMLPNSRSQTQQGSYAFQPNNVPGQHHPQQTPYSHLQNGSSNASPSRVLGHQMLPGGVPQQVSTSSPHSFSPAPQQYPAQASPSHSDHGGRSDTPVKSFPHNPGFTSGFNQNFTPPPGRTSAPPQNPAAALHQPQHMHGTQAQMFAQQSQQQQQRQAPLDPRAAYEMRLRQAQSQGQPRPNVPPNINPMAQSPSPQQVQNGQFQQMMRPVAPPLHPDVFNRNLSAFMNSYNKPLDLSPQVGDQKINLLTLYSAVGKYGGYNIVTQRNGWSHVAQALQFNPADYPNVAQILKKHYENNLIFFERVQQEQRVRTGNMGGPQISPTKPMNQAQIQHSQQVIHHQQLQQQHTQAPAKQMTPIPQAQTPTINGFFTPQTPQHLMGQNHSRNSLSRSVEATPPQSSTTFPMPSPSSTKHGSIALPSPGPAALDHREPPEKEQQVDLPDVFDPTARSHFKVPLHDPTKLLPTSAESYGGLDIAAYSQLGEKLSQLRPNIPSVMELGTIDIHALTMSLQCGIHSEVRLALDTLASLSQEPRVQLELRACEDLVETLIDCAEEQVELLAENAAEVSDVMLVGSYEDVVRGCWQEEKALRDIPAFNSLDYDLDRAVERLICITTILRNFSFLEGNHSRLANEVVIKFLSVVIRYLGTRNMLLRTNQNTLDFMKDVIVFLSNVAHAVELPGREQALCVLHFLLAFAPCPPPHSLGLEKVSFSTFNPAIHRYLPHAVDSLAKLLARDEPNRTHCKTIFASDVASTPPYDLLTRAFALAISPVPDPKQDTKQVNPGLIIEARKPNLMQGMLAAEILSNLAPGYDSGVAHSWLTSDDGFSQSLFGLVQISYEAIARFPVPRGQGHGKPPEDESLLRIAIGGIAVLRSLAEKSRDPDSIESLIPAYILPKRETLLNALKNGHPKLQGLLKQLCAYAGLDT